MPSNWDWGTVPQWFSAAISFGALCIAWRASNAWIKTLNAKRKEDAVASVHDLAAALGRLQAAATGGQSGKFGECLDACHDKFKEMKKCCVIAGNSEREDYKNAVDQMHYTLEAAKTVFQNAIPVNRDSFHDAAPKAQDRIGQLRASLEKDLLIKN
jgi:conjugal transfer/entry exclusion protein